MSKAVCERQSGHGSANMKRILAVGIAGFGLAVGLLCAEPPGGLTPPAAADTGSSGRPLPELVGKVLTIRQGSRPPEKFVTLRAWERPDKTVIRYLRSEETQELATLVEPPNSAQAQLYRWGPGRQQPPPGVPTIPDGATANPLQSSPGLVRPAGAGEKPSATVATGSRAPLSATPATGSSSGSWLPVTPGTAASSVVRAPDADRQPGQKANSMPNGGVVTSAGANHGEPAASAPKNSADRLLTDSTVLRQLSQLDRVGDVITLDLPDKGTQRCRILRKIVAADGTVTLTVRCESDGELMTVTTAPIAAPTASVIDPSVSSGGRTSGNSGVAPGSPARVTATSAATSPPTLPPAVVLLPDSPQRESLSKSGGRQPAVWSRLTRRIFGTGTGDGSPGWSSRMPASSELVARDAGNIPPPAPAPAPREVGAPPASIVSGSETRIVVGPVPASSGETRTGSVSSSSIPAVGQNPSESRQPLAKATPGSRPVPPNPSVSSSATASATENAAVPASKPDTDRRRGLFNRLFHRDSDRTVSKPGVPPAASSASLSPEQLAGVQYQFAVLAQATAVLPMTATGGISPPWPKRVVPISSQPPVPFPPSLPARPTASKPATPAKPDPLREPEKFVKHNPARETVTNAGLMSANPSKPPSPTLPEPSSASVAAGSGVGGKPAATSAVSKPATGQPSAGSTSLAPVPMPFVPMVSDKPRPDLPPPQPPIQPFNTLQVAAVQNPHQFPNIVPPVVPSQPNAAATPVVWARGPLIPPQQSPVQSLAVQAGSTGTEALALRNTLFLVNVLQTSGSPQQREWAAAKLAVIEPNRYPFAVEALVQAARHDPHPAVRIKAIQSLAIVRADTPAVRQTLQSALADADPRIREQAGYALQLLGSPAAEITPASYKPESK